MNRLPLEVARFILFHQLHPLASWRMYLSLSQKEMAAKLDLQLSELIDIEQSNKHLKSDIIKKFCNAFDLKKEHIDIRYITHYST